MPFRSPWPKRGATLKKSSAHEVGLKYGFRSGLEEKNAAHLQAHSQPVLFETLKLSYMVPETRHNYTPDFILRNGIIVETKGRFLPVDRAKHLFVRAQYPHLDIRMVFSNPKAPIATGSKTTLAAWSEAHGILWAAKLIPVEWMDEVGPEVRPEVVIGMGPWGYQLKRHKEDMEKAA